MERKKLPDYIMNFDQFAAMDKFEFNITPGWVTKAKEFHEKKEESKETCDRKKMKLLKEIKSKLPQKLGLILEDSLWGNNINIDVVDDVIEVQLEHLPIKWFDKNKISEAIKWIKEQFENR